MIIDQAEIENLRAQATVEDTRAQGAPSAPASPHASASPRPAAQSVGRPPSQPASREPAADAPPHVRRLLRIRVPAIVQLTATRMPIGALRKLSLGTILEFDKVVDDPLELLINNRPVARGETVKAGENFGLRITAIHSPAERIRSMGR